MADPENPDTIDLGIDDAEVQSLFDRINGIANQLSEGVKLVNKIQQSTYTLKKDWKDLNSAIQNANRIIQNKTNQKSSGSNPTEDLVDLIKRYNDQLEETTKLWDNITGRIKKSQQSTGYWANTWALVKKDWKDLAKTIQDISVHLLKWSTYVGIFKGLLGGGGLYGMEGLGASAASGRRQALGFGTDYGKMNSFMLNFQRLVDAQSVLSRISASKYDITAPERIGMIGLGLGGPREIAKDPTEQAIDAAKRVPEILKGLPQDMILPYAKAKSLMSIFSPEDIIRLVKEDPEQMRQMEDMYKSHEKELTLTKEQQSHWTKFMIQLDLAAKMIETAFQRKLANLGDSLGNLSDTLARKIITIINSEGFDVLINEVIKGLDSFGKWLDDPEVGKKLESVMDKMAKFALDAASIFDGITWLAKKIKSILEWLGVATATGKTVSVTRGGEYEGSNGSFSGFSVGGASYGSLPSYEGTGGHGTGMPPPISSKVHGPYDVAATARSTALDLSQRALLDVIASGESGSFGGAYNVQRGGGTFSDYSHHPGRLDSGRYQDIPSTWARIQRQFGMKDFSPESQDIGNWKLAESDYASRTGGSSLYSDMHAGNWDKIQRFLAPTWVSWYKYSPKHVGEAYNSSLERETEAYKKGGGGRGELFQHIRRRANNAIKDKIPDIPWPPPRPESMATPPNPMRNAGNARMWQGRSSLALNVYDRTGANTIIGASQLGLGPA